MLVPDKENLHLLLNQQKRYSHGELVNLTDDSFYDAGVRFQHLASQIARI